MLNGFGFECVESLWDFCIVQITTDINEDVERQNLMLDDTNNSFSSFANSLSQSTRRAGQAFGLTEGGLRISRVVLIVLGLFFAFWIGNKILGFWRAHA
ncbi:hypothetical protein HGRIS_014310 [Hohenbuehelia grisea]|uniref:t-SNARE coiled-coil homology domain-containing protein n=1 Tax=Hohenbuehelia grisea TaxID=104357 RepID=A0ABR3JV81_9AGAR